MKGVQAVLRSPEALAGRPDSEIAARLATPEQAALAGALGAEAEARRWAESLRHVRLAVDGEDVLAAGVAPGPEVGRVLEELLALRLDGALPDDRDAQLAAARRISTA
jgi:tRNA nucleotidyltransferase (CCA-adding enzyme)